MSNNKYFIKMGGLNEFVLSPNVDDTSADVTIPKSSDSPLENPTDVKVATPNIVGMSIKGSSTSTTSTGEVPPKSALAGYEPVDNEKNNSEIVDKTPDNSELNDPSQLKNDEPSTSEEEHPHQIQGGNTEAGDSIEHSQVTSNEPADASQGTVDIEVDENETPEHEINPELNENANKLQVGQKAKISGGSGVDSDKVVTIVDKSNIVTTGFGTPSNVKGAYKPVDWNREVAIQYEDGSFGTMFKNRLIPISSETKDECKDCGCNVNTDKINKLQALHEKLAMKSFKTMKEVMLLNEARKIINNAKR